MATRNLIMLSGRIVGEPKAKDGVFAFRMLNSEVVGDKENRAEVIVKTYGELAGKCAGLKEGDRVYVEGMLQHRTRELPSGSKTYFTEILAQKVDC